MTTEDVNQEFEELLQFLRKSRGFDFTGYKRPSLMRRVQRRMQVVGIESYPDYIDYLEVHPEEFGELFNTILINVTAFFRDPAVWDELRFQVIPQMVEHKPAGESIRVWCVGCATGEEAYTVAMVLAEVLGIDRFRERVKVYATDVDEDALARARQGGYSAREVAGIPHELLEKYFERFDERYVFRRDLRRTLIFGRHDVIQDAPISRIDLLLCRNTLMYFNGETQARVLSRLQFALVEGGILVLGRAEMLFTQAGTFSPVDLKRRVFSKGPRSVVRLRPEPLLPAADGLSASPSEPGRARDEAFDIGPIAQIVIDSAGRLALANERARALFDLRADDLGRPVQDLQFSYRPAELRSLIDQARADWRTVAIRDVPWQPAGISRWLDIQVTPLGESASSAAGVSITFTDVTDYRQLQDELQHSHQELETAYEELQSTVEELETTNEELQSTVEELETTNEELQSTNEELETMNEELQSTNEELQTINDELRLRSDALNETNALMESILSSLRAAVIVVDGGFHVRVWNRQAEELWGVRRDEAIDHSFFSLDIGLPVHELRQPIRACLSGESASTQLALDATNRRGRPIRCEISITSLIGAHASIEGAILLINGGNGAAANGS